VTRHYSLFASSQNCLHALRREAYEYEETAAWESPQLTIRHVTLCAQLHKADLLRTTFCFGYSRTHSKTEILTCEIMFSSAGIATGYRREFESQEGENFSLLHIVQIGSGVHPTSYKLGTGGNAAGA
jgi:hypothetical protein